MALIWIAVVCLLKLFKFSSAQKFNIAIIAQAGGFTLFVFSFLDAYINVGKQIPAVSFPAALLNINASVATYFPYLAIVYLCILMFKLIKFVFGYTELKKIKKYELKKISPEFRVFVQHMSALLSLHKKVKICLSGKITCPLTIGFLKPIILVPVAAVNHLTAEQMEAVILHELAHIKRADYLLFILQSFIDRIFFYNIFSIMLSDIIERERENACDDLVMQFRYNSMHYAEALFKLGRLKALHALAMPFSGKKESLLLIRIRRLLHKSQSGYCYNWQSVFYGMFSIMMAACLFCFSFEPLQKKTTNYNATVKTNAIKTAEPIMVAEVAAKEKEPAKKVVAKAERTYKMQPHKEAEAAFDIAKEQKKNQDDLYTNELAAYQDAFKSKQDQLLQVQYKLDSLRTVLPQINSAVNSQIIVTPELVQKANSYQNFKTLETMLALSGNNIKITESDSTKNSYQKQITIQSTDKNGNKHIYTVIVQLYQ